MAKGREWTVRFLLDNGAHVDEDDEDGKTPLHVAVSLPNQEIARILLEKGANFNKPDCDNRYPLEKALAFGRLQLVQFLIDNGAHGVDPLHWAAHNHTNDVYDIYKLLLDSGADCNARNARQWTPLLAAVEEQSLEIVRLTLDHGADMTYSNKGTTVIHSAARNPRTDVLKFMLDQGFDIEGKDRNGRTPLHIAAECRNVEGCKILLERGAMIDSGIRQTGQTPLIRAIVRGLPADVPIIEVLLEYGANMMKRPRGYYRRLLELVTLSSATQRIKNLLLREMAKTAHSGSSIQERKSFHHNYLASCLTELGRMEVTTFYNDVSLRSILTLSRQKISAYARNGELIDALKVKMTTYRENFPIYFPSLENRFFAEVKKQQLRNEAAEILNALLFNGGNYYVTQNILSYLRDHDITYLEM